MSTVNDLLAYQEVDAIFSATETIRRRIKEDSRKAGVPVDTRRTETQVEYAKILLKEIEMSGHDDPVTTAVIQQIKRFIQTPQNRFYLVDMRLDSKNYGPNHFLLMAFTKISKAPDSIFETAICERIFPKVRTRELKSIACPVDFKRISQGLNSPTMLGWFPEHCGARLQNHQYVEGAKAIYIISRFARRFKQVTLKAIKTRTTASSFRKLKAFFKNASDEELVRFFLEAPSVWLTLHESLHADSELPLHKYLDVFKQLELGGFEELRVDLLSMLEIRSLKDYDWAELVSEYILAERMFAYPLIDFLSRKGVNPIPSFDTFGSHYLFLRLLEEGGVSIVENGPDKGKVNVNCERCFSIIGGISDELSKLYRDAKVSGEKAGKGSDGSKFCHKTAIQFLRNEIDRVILGHRLCPTIDFSFDLRNRRGERTRTVEFRMLQWFGETYEAIAPIDI